MKRVNCVCVMLAVLSLIIFNARVSDLTREIERVNTELEEVRNERDSLRDTLTDVEIEYNYLSNRYYNEISGRVLACKEIERLQEEELIEDSMQMDYAFISSLSEVDLLARCCSAEAGTTNYESQKGIAQVILNRVEDDSFPDSIKEVIYQEGQFHVVDNGAINKSVSDKTLYNVISVILYGYKFPEDILYFHAEKAGSRNAYACIEGTAFFEKKR